MSDSVKSKRSRKNRGHRRRNKNKAVSNNTSNNNNNSAKGSCESLHNDDDEDTATPPEECQGRIDEANNMETLSESVKMEIHHYRVESPKEMEKKKILHAPKSKSLDNDDDKVLSIVELDIKSDEEKSFVESNAIVTEAESDIEWETTDCLATREDNSVSISNLIEPPCYESAETQRVSSLSPQKELDLRQFLQTLNLSSSPMEVNQIPDVIKAKPPEANETDIKVRKMQTKAALEEHCISQMMRSRFLDIIDEESSIESSDATKLQSRSDSFKYIDDLEDDVFISDDKKSKEPKEHFPKHRDYLARKRELRRQQECRLVGAKIVEAEFEEGCGDWTIEKTEQKRGAEIVYLEDSSSSASENNEDIDPEHFESDERVDIKTPVIELNAQFDSKLMPDEPENDAKVSQETSNKSDNTNEELIESLESLLVNPPVPVACNEVIMLANEFVDELPIVTEILNESKSMSNINEKTSVEEPKFEEYSRQDSSSSACSSHSTTHSTAKYNPLSSSLTDIDALVHDDTVPNTVVNIVNEKKTDTATQANLIENVTGSEAAFGSPGSLKELCVDKIATLKYGSTILTELASVSQTLSDFANEVLSREVNEIANRGPPVPARKDMLNIAYKVPKLPPALQLEKTPPPVAPRQSSFKVLQEDPQWIGLQSQKDPSLVAYLSPLQKKEIERTKNYSQDEAGELIDMHCKYAERRCYNEETEKMPSNNNDDKITVQVERSFAGERAAPDTGNRLLAIIRDPAVNPKAQQENDETEKHAFDFMETLRTFEDMNKNAEDERRYRSWTKKEANVKESLEVAEQYTSNQVYRATVKDQGPITNGTVDHNEKIIKVTLEDDLKAEKQSKERIIDVLLEDNKPNERIIKVTLDGDTHKENGISNERIIKVTMETDTKSNEKKQTESGEKIIEITMEEDKSDIKKFDEKSIKQNGNFMFDDPKREMQYLHNKRTFILDDPIFESIPKHDFGKEYRVGMVRRSSLPKDLHERQMQYIIQKEKEIEEQIKQLEEEKQYVNIDEINEKYRISRQRDVATYQSDFNKEFCTKARERPVNASAPSQGEKFREQMYCEYMDKVAEREERKQNKVIKITNVPTPNTTNDIIFQTSDKSTLNEIRHTCNKIEEEFITKARERWDKMGFKDEEKCENIDSKPVVIEHKIKVLDSDGEKDMKKLPTHLQEFVEFTSNGDESEPVMFAPTFKAKAPASGVWSPGAVQSAKQEPSKETEAVNGEAKPSEPSGAPAPPPPPPPVWTPRSKESSPVASKKEFRPVPFESPKLPRKTIKEQKSESAPPPWEVRLAGSQSAPEAAGLSGLTQSSPQTPPAPALPRAQNPTIVLLQKAREGQLPRGASYLEQDRDLPNDRRITPPRIQPGEVVYSLRRGYMSEPESGSDKPRKMADLTPRKYEGIGPTTKDGMPLTLRSEVKETNQSKWYKKMYDTIHKNKYDDDYVTVRYKSRRAHPSALHTAPRQSQYAYFNPKSGYLSEPEGGVGPGGWNSDAYDSDVPLRRHSALDRRRVSDKENEISYLSSNKFSTLASAKASQEMYKSQPGRIEDYIPGRSSVIDKEAKQWWDEVMDIFDGWLDENSPLPPYSTLLARAIQRSQLASASLHHPQINKQNPPSSILSKSYMARALKESGYESDSTLVLRRREGSSLEAPLSPQEQKLAYRSLQAGGEPPLQGFRKPAPDKPKDDTEIEYMPLSPTLTRIRVHKNQINDKRNKIVCYPITVTNPEDIFNKYQQAVPSFISFNYPKAGKHDPPVPPRRHSSKANSTLKLMSSISPGSRLLQTRSGTSVKYLQTRISNKFANAPPTKENRKKEVRETKMKSSDGKRIKTTRAAISVPNSPAIIKSSKTKKTTIDNVKGTSSFSSPRRTMSPIDYAMPVMNRYFTESSGKAREVIEGGAGKRTPISGILDRSTSLERTFASEKKNLPLKSIQELPKKQLSKSTELLSPTEVAKVDKENKPQKPSEAIVRKLSTSCSSIKMNGKNTDEKLTKSTTSTPSRGRELLRTSDKLKSLTSPGSQISKSTSREKIGSFFSNIPVRKISSKTSIRSRKSLDDLSTKVKSSNSSLNSIRSSKSIPKSSKGTEKNYDTYRVTKPYKDNQFGDFKGDKNGNKSKKLSDKRSSPSKVKPSTKQVSKAYDQDTLRYLKSVNREIDAYVAQYEKSICPNYNEIVDQRDAIMSDSFFQHLLLRDVPPHSPVDFDPDFHSTSVLEKARFFQNVHENISPINRPINSYLVHKKPVTDSKFRSWDRCERSRPRSPRAVSWPGRMSQSCIKKFESLLSETPVKKLESRSRSEPSKIVFPPTGRPRSPIVIKSKRSDSPKKIIHMQQRGQSPPTKIVFSQTSRPLSPVIMHSKKRKLSEPERLPSPSKIVLTQTSRTVTPVVTKKRFKESEQIRSRSESPVIHHKYDVNYYSDSEPTIRKMFSPVRFPEIKGSRKIREASPSPSPIRSPSCRRIHSARISQCRGADECIMGLKKKVIRTQSAGDAESKKKRDSPAADSFIRSSSFLNLDHIRDHLRYQEYITELKHQKTKSNRFKELNRFYAYLERIGELEKATSSCDLHPRRREEEIIDFEKWKRVRALERAEEELDRLYKKMKMEQQEKDLLFLPHDAESLKWSQNKDWNLRSKEKSVEDLKEHFNRLAEAETDSIRYCRRGSDFEKDTYKPLWRGNSVVNLASSLTKKGLSETSGKLERVSSKLRAEPTITNLRERLGIGSRLWSSLSMEQVSALKNQLNSIYSKELDLKSKEGGDVHEDYIITIPDSTKEKPKNGLQVRCNSFTVGDMVSSIEPSKNIRADSISSLQHVSPDKEIKELNASQQDLSEKEKKRISLTLSQEVLERVKQHKEKLVLAKETRGATAAARIRGIPKTGAISPRAQSLDSLKSDRSKTDIIDVIKKDDEIRDLIDWSDIKESKDKKSSVSPIRTSSASETETGSSDTSNRTVIYRGPKDEVQKKVDFFEKSLKDSTPSTIIHHARDDSGEEKFDSLQSFEELKKLNTSMESKSDLSPISKTSYSQSYSNLKELFGETQKNAFSSLSPIPPVGEKSTKDSVQDSLKDDVNPLLSSENICRSRSLSPDPERYWRAYLSLVKAGEVQKLKMKFEDAENLSSLEDGSPCLRRHQSDPEIIRTILQYNWDKKRLNNVREHERGDVDRLTHKYETSTRGRSRYRKHGLTSPIPKSILRAEDREMPHIDVISKMASLKQRPSVSIISTAEYPIECPIGEVSRIKEQFEKGDSSLLGQMFTSTPDIRELRDIAPYLTASWTTHKYPKRQDNNRSLSTSDYLSEDKYSPVRKDKTRPKSTSPVGAKIQKPILKQTPAKVDVFANQEFDPIKHRPKYRYEPPREETPPARPAYPQQFQASRPTVTFRDPELAPIPPPKGIPISRHYSPESPRRYVEGDVNIHYRVPVRQEPRPLVPEDELARRQADHMRRVYQEERRRKYLQELQDMNSRRHTDNFTPSQKSPIALNRYDSFGTRQVARALYNFVGQGTRELSFRKGDLILVRRQIDNNWYEGEHNSAVGLFPYNYVEMIQYDSTTTPSQRRPTEGRARAKFNFVAQTHLELGLRKGELVTLIRRVDENWYEGRLGDRKGIFPVSYVEVLAEPLFNRADLPPSIVSGKPIASPAAHSMVGAAGAASIGAHHYTPQLNSPALSNSPSSTAPLALPNHGITSHHARPASATLPRASDHTPINLNNHEPLYVDTNAEAVPYRAMYKYKPQNPDELELHEGETVYVLEKCDDGWYVGSSQRTGRFGTFPGNYVEKI